MTASYHHRGDVSSLNHVHISCSVAYMSVTCVTGLPLNDPTPHLSIEHMICMFQRQQYIVHQTTIRPPYMVVAIKQGRHCCLISPHLLIGADADTETPFSIPLSPIRTHICTLLWHCLSAWAQTCILD